MGAGADQSCFSCCFKRRVVSEREGAPWARGQMLSFAILFFRLPYFFTAWTGNIATKTGAKLPLKTRGWLLAQPANTRYR